MHIVLVANPSAGGGRGAREAPVVADLLSSAGHDVHPVVRPSEDAARALLVAALAAGGVDAVVAVGGDGTVHLALGAVREHAPLTPIGVVAAGSGNDLARSLDLPVHDPVAATTHLLAALQREPTRLDLGRVRELGPDGAVGPGAHWFLNVASAGVDAAVNARANRLASRLGRARYLVGLAAELVAFRGYAVRVVADGADLGDCGTIVAIGNSRSIGGGMLIAPAASLTDGLLDVVVARTVGRALLATVFPRVYCGTHVAHPVVRVVRTPTVDVLPDPDRAGRADPPLLHADGEALCRLPVRVDVVPKAVPVLL